MYINFVNDRKELKYKCLMDTQCGNRLVLITDSSVVYVKNASSNGKRKILGIITGIIIIFSNFEIETVGPSMTPQQRIVSKEVVYRIRGGFDYPDLETENREKGKLIQSIITKSSGYNDKSFNKIIKEVFSRLEPLLFNSTFWRIVHLAGQPIEHGFVVEGAFTNSPLLNPKMQKYNNQCPRNFQDAIALSSDTQMPLVDTPSPQPTEKISLGLSEEYKDFVNHLESVGIENRFDTNKISEEKFIQLATDPFRKEITKQSIKEARTCTQAELEGYILNPQRPPKTIAQIVDLDMWIDGPSPYTHFDPKDLVGSATLQAQGQRITLEEMAFNCGVKIAKQKKEFIGLHESAPKSPQNVLHAVNLGDIAVSEKKTVKDFVKKGFKSQENSIYGIIFLNE